MKSKKGLFLILVCAIGMALTLVSSAKIDPALPHLTKKQTKTVPDISGEWDSSIGVLLLIKQEEKRFYWQNPQQQPKSRGTRLRRKNASTRAGSECPG